MTTQKVCFWELSSLIYVSWRYIKNQGHQRSKGHENSCFLRIRVTCKQLAIIKLPHKLLGIYYTSLLGPWLGHQFPKKKFWYSLQHSIGEKRKKVVCEKGAGRASFCNLKFAYNFHSNYLQHWCYMWDYIHTYIHTHTNYTVYCFAVR